MYEGCTCGKYRSQKIRPIMLDRLPFVSGIKRMFFALLQSILARISRFFQPILKNKVVYVLLHPKEYFIYPIFELVLLFIHNLWLMYETFCWIKWEITDMFLFFSQQKMSVNTLVPTLKKVPKHLGIIVRTANAYELPEKYFTASELYEVIIWARCAGIERVNLYDPNAYYVGRRTSIQNFLKRLNVTVLTAEEKMVRKNGVYPDSYLHELVLLNPSDGKEALVNAIKSIIKSGQAIHENENVTNNLPNITPSEIKTAVSIFGDEVPDPDMIIHIGNAAVSLEGYPPWHVRLTEIFHLEPWKRLTENEFCKLLQRYSRCEQRLGK